MKRLAILALVFASLASAEHRKLAKLSRIAIVVAASADIGTSWGKQEANPLLRSHNGSFGARGTTIKLGMLAAWLVASRKIQKEPVAVWGNFATAGFVGSVAIRNWRIR
jgi:hypothetical protein